MVKRFIFRQFDYRDLATFIADGEIRSKRHSNPQACHQTSHANIVGLRATNAFTLPHGGVVNDYVPFYFSPITAFAFSVNNGNVEVLDLQGNSLGASTFSERAFFVLDITEVFKSSVKYCYSDHALNSSAIHPQITNNPGDLETHIDWPLFDEGPLTAKIPQIGYSGSCKYFFTDQSNEKYAHRTSSRMAEFLIRDVVPLSLVSWIITPNKDMTTHFQAILNKSKFNIQVLTEDPCFCRS